MTSAVKPGVAARQQAAAIIGRVVRSGAWSNVLLRQVALPEPDDRALVRFLVYGVLRHLEDIDAAIGAAADRPLGAIDDDVLDVLRVAVYEVLFGRTPDHAVTDTAVETAKVIGKSKAAGFVNGVVRAVQRHGAPPRPAGLAGAFAVGQWLVDALSPLWGEGGTLQFLSASREAAPLCLRARRAGLDTDSLTATEVPGAFVAAPGTTVPPGFAVQDAASVAVGEALQVQPGDRVLDLAAAPGGKTLQLADSGPGLLVAVERHPRRLRSARRRMAAEGVDVHWVRADATAPPFADQSFDRVLLDAPCSGLGTLRRRPEIRLRVSEQEVARLATLQRRMLEAALPLVAPGGMLVYSVCTVTPAETTGVVAGLSADAPAGLPGRRLEGGLLMAPHLTETDGMFISMIRP